MGSGLGSELDVAGEGDVDLEGNVDVEGKGVGDTEAVGSFFRKRRALKAARSGPQMGSTWMRAPGMSSAEPFFSRYRFARRVSSVTQREEEDWVRWRRSSRKVEWRSGVRVGVRAVMSIMCLRVPLWPVVEDEDGDGGMVAWISARISDRRVGSE